MDIATMPPTMTRRRTAQASELKTPATMRSAVISFSSIAVSLSSVATAWLPPPPSVGAPATEFVGALVVVVSLGIALGTALGTALGIAAMGAALGAGVGGVGASVGDALNADGASVGEFVGCGVGASRVSVTLWR